MGMEGVINLAWTWSTDRVSIWRTIEEELYIRIWAPGRGLGKGLGLNITTVQG